MLLSQNPRAVAKTRPLPPWRRGGSHNNISSQFIGYGLGFIRSVGGRPLLHRHQQTRRPLPRPGALKCRSMVNVDVFAPSLLLGVLVIGSGVLLTTVRSSKARISKDSDVFLSSLIIVSGGTLVFQGWRLDPLMLLCQFMICSVAATFALEALNLRKRCLDEKDSIDSEWTPPQRPISRKPAREEEDDGDTFFYGMDDIPYEKRRSTGLPPARSSSLNDYLSRDAVEMGWTVDDDSDMDPYDADDEEGPPWDTTPRQTQQNPRRGDGTLQTVEDWE